MVASTVRERNASLVVKPNPEQAGCSWDRGDLLMAARRRAIKRTDPWLRLLVEAADDSCEIITNATCTVQIEPGGRKPLVLNSGPPGLAVIVPDEGVVLRLEGGARDP